MKRVVMALLLVFTGYAQATVIIDPVAGYSSSFSWDDGLGQIDTIAFNATDIDWSITAATDSVMTLVTAIDDFVPGDEFALVLDGSVVAWTSTFIDGSSHFNGVFDDLFLSAGVHTLTLNVVALAPGFNDGVANVSFSGLVSVVPAPSVLALIGLGIIGMGRFTRIKSSV